MKKLTSERWERSRLNKGGSENDGNPEPVSCVSWNYVANTQHSTAAAKNVFKLRIISFSLGEKSTAPTVHREPTQVTYKGLRQMEIFLFYIVTPWFFQ